MLDLWRGHSLWRGHCHPMALHAGDRHLCGIKAPYRPLAWALPLAWSLPIDLWRGHSLWRGHCHPMALHAGDLHHHYHPLRAFHAKNILAPHAPSIIKSTSDWWHAHAEGFWGCFWRECLTSCVGTLPPAWAFWVSSVGIFWCKLL